MIWEKYGTSTLIKLICPTLIQAKVVVLLVLLVSWMEDPPNVQQDYQVIEFFAGVGRIAGMAHHAGYQTAKYDLDYGTSRSRASGRSNPMNLNSDAGFVLAVKLILRGKFNELISMFAVVCSSFVPVNRGTGHRDLLVPEGDEGVVSVRKGNKLISRILGGFYHSS